MNFLIQSVVFPSIGLCTDEDLYYTGNSENYLDFDEKKLNILKGKRVSFNTFFNSLSIKKWKKYTTIDNLSLHCNIQGEGYFYIRYFDKNVDYLIAEHRLSSGEQDISIPLDNIESGYLYVSWYSLNDSVLSEMNFFTTCDAVNSKMALVITTFNRENAVIKTVERLKNNLLNDERYKGNIELFLINNGNDLPLESSDGFHIIKNKNLGGSGGFARGLIESQQADKFTHCVFMDDDAACEIDSIRRTFAFLSLANDPNIAVTAAMLYEERPRFVHEVGAITFRYGIFHAPSKIGLDISNPWGLIEFDNEEKIGYGAWWFYAFNISVTSKYPFPFFVRGDDIMFGMMNDNHRIVALNGVASWQMDFNRKFTPMVQYLSFRSIFIPACLQPSKSNWLMLSAFFMREVLFLAMSYRYESAMAIIESYNDCTKGIDFWRENVDCIEIRKKIGSLTKNEKFILSANDIADVKFDGPLCGHESRLHKYFRLLTLNGHLLPASMFGSRPRFIPETHRTPTNMVFKRKSIYFISESTGGAMELKHSKRDFFYVLLTASVVMLKTFFPLKTCMKQYQEDIPKITTRKFWENIFKL